MGCLCSKNKIYPDIQRTETNKSPYPYHNRSENMNFQRRNAFITKYNVSNGVLYKL